MFDVGKSWSLKFGVEARYFNGEESRSRESLSAASDRRLLSGDILGRAPVEDASTYACPFANVGSAPVEAVVTGYADAFAMTRLRVASMCLVGRSGTRKSPWTGGEDGIRSASRRV